MDSVRSPRGSRSPSLVTTAPRTVKMDSIRAHSIMGFSSARWLDFLVGRDHKDELDQALRIQMNYLMSSKKKDLQPVEKPFFGRRKSSAKEEPEGQSIHDVLVLHEAYQFLVQKYVKAKPKKKTDDDRSYEIKYGETNDCLNQCEFKFQLTEAENTPVESTDNTSSTDKEVKNLDDGINNTDNETLGKSDTETDLSGIDRETTDTEATEKKGKHVRKLKRKKSKKMRMSKND